MMNVTPDGLADAIVKSLTEYGDLVTDGMKQAVDKVTEEVNDEIKRHVTFRNRSGKYIRAFRFKTSYEDKRNKRNTWYVSGKQYRKTHLLEKGHNTRSGSRTRAFQHIAYGEELAQRRLPELIEEVIKNG